MGMTYLAVTRLWDALMGGTWIVEGSSEAAIRLFDASSISKD